MSSIALCGFYGKNNYGDDLMAACLSQRLSIDGTKVSIYSDVFRDNVLNGMKDHSFLTANTIVIGGGNIIGPGFWAFKDNMIKLLPKDGRVVFLNVGLTQDYINETEFAQSLKDLNARWWVRDIESQNILFNLGINSSFLPDISLTLNERLQTEKNEKTIGVLLNAYPMNNLFNNDNVYMHQRAHQFARVLAHHLDWMSSFGWKIQFLPCHVSTPIDDRLIAAVVFGYMQNKKSATWHTEHMSWKNLSEAISKCELVFSMRYHASTTAVASKTRFVDLVHHDKNKQFVKYMQAEKCMVDIWTATHESLISATVAAEGTDTNSWHQCESAQVLWRNFDSSWKNIIEKNNATK